MVLPKRVHSSAFHRFMPRVSYLNFKIAIVIFFSSLHRPSSTIDLFLVNSLPLIKADCLKFLIDVRNQIDRDALLGSIPECVRYLSSNNIVVQTYAAHAFERVLLVRPTTDAKQTT